MFHILSPDDYKEEMWDRYGFDSMEEKEANIQKAWTKYYEDMEDMMHMHMSVLSDYPFSEKQRSRLEQMASANSYQIETIRLYADLDVLYER
ncbi:kinase, partial [Erysipelatoclostridium ramosum]|nr:kinase [Thomasclavelia ramosa]